MCSVKHLLVQTKVELQDALFRSQYDEMDCVIEVESSIDANATFHRLLGSNALLRLIFVLVPSLVNVC
jgi:hypothetical protein